MIDAMAAPCVSKIGSFADFRESAILTLQTGVVAQKAFADQIWMGLVPP